MFGKSPPYFKESINFIFGWGNLTYCSVIGMLHYSRKRDKLDATSVKGKKRTASNFEKKTNYLLGIRKISCKSDFLNTPGKVDSPSKISPRG